jgi:tetratricopeptide (TPR) repeat protein
LRPGADEAQQLARRLLEPGAPMPAPGEATRELAWALKDLCYEAWSTEPPRAARAADVLRAVAGQGASLAQAGEVGALADWAAGIAHVTRGDMAEAVHCFDRAAAEFRDAGLPDPAAQTQVPKIMALSMLGQHAQAAACAEAAQAELLALGNLPAASRVSLNLGNLQLLRDAYPEAAHHFREAAVLFARVGDHEQSVIADIGLAAALTSMGQFDDALRIYARTRLRAGNRGFEVLLALVDESVALVDLARGRYSEALAGFEAVRRRYEALRLPQHLAIAEKQLADAYLELRLLPEALALFNTAVLQFGALALPDEQAWALAQRGRTEALLGLAEAGASFAAAADLFAAQGNAVGESSVAVARAELALAGADAEAALAWAEHAAQGFTDAGQADGRARAEVIRAHALLLDGEAAQAHAVFDTTLASARELQQLQVQVRCLTGQGLVARASGDDAVARLCFDAAIELFEDQRRALPGDEIRSAFLSDHLRPYQERLRMALSAGAGDEVLVQLARFRARTLAERLDAGTRPELDEGAPELRDRLNWLYRHVQRLQDEGGGSAALSSELLRTERELLERARRQRLRAPAHPATGDAGPFSVAELQGALKAGDALVEYGEIDDELFACIVTPESVVLCRQVARWPQVLEAARSVRFQIDALRHGAAAMQPHLGALNQRMQARLVELHALVWAPLASLLSACRRVLVVPHAQLGGLPFAALTDGAVALGRQFELAMAPSARIALRGLLRQPLPARRVLALGESTRLPHAAREAVFVAGLFAHGQAFVGEQATVQTLRAHAGSADIVHLACHAQFRSDNPRFSALHLHDGALTVDLAEGLALAPCTVVLSACETGLVERGRGDEVVGLVNAFFVAGAARVVASLWPVDDEVTAGFMAQFYGALALGHGSAAALQTAQRATALAHPNPCFWGAFTLYGGW